ncbi:hypothetical protein AB0O76_07205 [Streptomyces sp. NPDC086554]|uniref:hypothetical protein n=1 Tax=Streptomyces sp. NPDC086554 TaxID=3154864 RepID=UPI003414FF7D
MREAQESLQEALTAEDAYDVAVAQDELDDALRLAQMHGVVTSQSEADDKRTVGE